MRTTSQTYQTLLASDAAREVKVVVGRRASDPGITYYSDQIVSVSTNSDLYDELRLGATAAGELNLTLYNPSGIDAMASVELYVRLNDGTTQSEWILLGVYYIDVREYDDTENTVEIQAFDAMLKGEATLEGEVGIWPRTDTDVLSLVCTQLGVSLDPRCTSLINRGYSVPFPSEQTYRDMLDDIGTAYGGNWCITAKLVNGVPFQYLRFVPLTGTGETSSLGQKTERFEKGANLVAISKVTLMTFADDDEEGYYEAGTIGGYELTAACTYASQTMANNLLTAIQGYIYRSFKTNNSLIDPALELGDGVVVDNTIYPVISIKVKHDTLYTADISAPNTESVNHEYSYQTETQKALNRTVKLDKSYYGTRISKNEGLTITKTVGNQDRTRVRLNSDELVFYDANGNEALYFDPVSGKYKFVGDVEINEGSISINNNFVVDEYGNARLSGDTAIYSATYYAGTPQNEEGYSAMTAGGFQIVNAMEQLKLLLGYTTNGYDYPFIQLGSGSGSSASLGLIKKFQDGLWIGNSAPKEASGFFTPVAGYNGMFFRFTDNKAYIVQGTDMQNIYTGEAVARFA